MPYLRCNYCGSTRGPGCPCNFETTPKFKSNYNTPFDNLPELNSSAKSSNLNIFSSLNSNSLLNDDDSENKHNSGLIFDPKWL